MGGVKNEQNQKMEVHVSESDKPHQKNIVQCNLVLCSKPEHSLSRIEVLDLSIFTFQILAN